MATNEQKKQIYANYQILLDRLQEEAANGNINEAESIKCEILYRVSMLINNL